MAECIEAEFRAQEDEKAACVREAGALPRQLTWPPAAAAPGEKPDLTDPELLFYSLRRVAASREDPAARCRWEPAEFYARPGGWASVLEQLPQSPAGFVCFTREDCVRGAKVRRDAGGGRASSNGLRPSKLRSLTHRAALSPGTRRVGQARARRGSRRVQGAGGSGQRPVGAGEAWGLRHRREPARRREGSQEVLLGAPEGPARAAGCC